MCDLKLFIAILSLCAQLLHQERRPLAPVKISFQGSMLFQVRFCVILLSMLFHCFAYIISHKASPSVIYQSLSGHFSKSHLHAILTTVEFNHFAGFSHLYVLLFWRHQQKKLMSHLFSSSVGHPLTFLHLFSSIFIHCAILSWKICRHHECRFSVLDCPGPF